VTLQASTPASATAAEVAKPDGSAIGPKPITNGQTLEQAILKLVGSLSANQSDGSIHLSTLGSNFAKIHQESLSKVLKRIGEPKGLPKFLAKCRSLRIQKRGTTWWVALAGIS
jgi:hypothetical protein